MACVQVMKGAHIQHSETKCEETTKQEFVECERVSWMSQKETKGSQTDEAREAAAHSTKALMQNSPASAVSLRDCSWVCERTN